MPFEKLNPFEAKAETVREALALIRKLLKDAIIVSNRGLVFRRHQFELVNKKRLGISSIETGTKKPEDEPDATIGITDPDAIESDVSYGFFEKEQKAFRNAPSPEFLEELKETLDDPNNKELLAALFGMFAREGLAEWEMTPANEEQVAGLIKLLKTFEK